MSGEEWRPIAGGRYAVSDRGRVRRDAAGRGARAGAVLRQHLSAGRRHIPGDGYLAVTLYRTEGAPTVEPVHVLVAEAFLPAPPGVRGTRRGQYQVNHRDGNKRNNLPENLEWVTVGDNVRHAFRTGLCRPPGVRGERHPNAKLTVDAVLEIRDRVRRGETHAVVGACHGVSASLVGQVASRTVWRHVP